MAIRLAVVIDANVLVQAPVRDTLLRSAEGPELYRPLWSAEIMAEVDRVLDTVTSTVVFVDLSEALTPLIKLAAAHAEPCNEVSGTDLGFRRSRDPAQDNYGRVNGFSGDRGISTSA